MEELNELGCKGSFKLEKAFNFRVITTANGCVTRIQENSFCYLLSLYKPVFLLIETLTWINYYL